MFPGNGDSVAGADDGPPPGRLAAFAAGGEAVESAANRPVDLSAPDAVWFVEEGALDVFLTEVSGERASASFQHVVRATEGALVFGFRTSADGAGIAALAKGLPGCRLRRLALATLLEAGLVDDLALQVDHWVTAVAVALAGKVESAAAADVRLAAGQSAEVEPARPIAAADSPVWIAAHAGLLLFGTEPVTEPPEAGTPGAPAGTLAPITPDMWVTAAAAARVEALSSRDLAAAGRLADALASFHEAAGRVELFNRRLRIADEANLQRVGAADRQRRVDEARRALFGAMQGGNPAATPLMAALDIVGAHEGIRFRAPRTDPGGEDRLSVRRIAQASGVRCRDVKLPRRGWWRGDSGALLAFRREDRAPVALVPDAAGYREHKPGTGRSQRLDAERAARLERTAWSFARALPHERAAGAFDLLRCAGRRAAGDLVRFVAAGLLAGLLSVAPALLLAAAIERALPSADTALLGLLAGGLVAVAAAVGLLLILRGTALLRLEARAAARLSAALWDRVLRLRSDFFRAYTAGDLAARVAVFDAVRDQISGAVGGALLTVVFLAPSFFLIFAYDPVLGAVSAGFGVLSFAVAAVFGALQFPHQKRAVRSARELAGDFLQFLNGIAKLRAAGAEPAAFTHWARKYGEQQAAAFRVGQLGAHFSAFSASLPGATAAALFAVAAAPGQTVGVGAFLAAYGVSMTFFAAAARLGHVFQEVAQLAPAAAQVGPLLSETPQAVPDEAVEADLQGGLSFEGVSYRYAAGAPLAVDDVSLHAAPGEFVAIVGETGCGKSTLLRLALGLADPLSGVVRYDGHDLAAINRHSVRRQVGVVMQNGALRPGTVLENIAGVARDVDIDAAWRAAEKAAVAADIEAMPMKMLTQVADTNMIFSGGQAQRIMIAAALVRDPRIIFLDEATSWLDTASQSAVMDVIERLTITRIVIAHRLSTIEQADRIYVMHRGRIVEQGRFQELLDTPGRFRRLMTRQLF